MYALYTHSPHSVDVFLSTQSQLSHDAAERHALLAALRERRRNERSRIARRLGLAPGPQHSRRRRARIGRTDQPIRIAATPTNEHTTKTSEVADE